MRLSSGEYLMLRILVEINVQLSAACSVHCVILAVFSVTKTMAQAAPGKALAHPCTWQAEQSGNSPSSLLFVLLCQLLSKKILPEQNWFQIIS